MIDALNKLMSKMKTVPREYECDICKDTGYIEEETDGYIYGKECQCLIDKRNKERQEKYIKESGLEKVLKDLTFDTYEDTLPANKAVKQKALDYLKEYKNNWWFIAGKSGCGKTHITTAICERLIKQNIPVYYMQWRDESTELKAVTNDKKYSEKISKLKKVNVLYIDDFFKGEVTKADIKLAFEIINARYVKSLTTMFSSELKIDEAIAGRINQKAKEYVLNIKKIGNRRLKI